MSDTETVPRLSSQELRKLFLFEALEDDQLAWLSEHGRVEQREQGRPVYSEGEPATCYFVLLSGTISMHRRVEDTDVEVNRTNQVGAYAGATQAFLRSEDPLYLNTVLAVTDCRFWVIEADSFGAKIREWFPMAMHLLEGMTLGMRTSQAAVGQRERLLSLGRLSAGLTHELNNPAAAAVRATASLRERVSRMRGKLAHLAGGEIDAQAFKALLEVQEAAIERMAKVEEMTTVEVADAEDAAADWLEEHGVPDGWDLAPALVAAGVDPDWLDEVAAKVPDELLGDGIKWVAYALETEQLMSEIEDSTLRISTLVGAAKQYSQLDRAAHADVDIKEGLISTIIMLKHKMKSGAPIELVKEFATDLPLVPAHPAELNQVWTNLIDNALQAMPDGGTLSIRTALDGDCVLVEIGDTGAGIPPELRDKIFEPFFTTKPVGEGTGLGLDICYRVVTQRHGGDLRVISEPGDTRFQVRLPVRAPASI